MRLALGILGLLAAIAGFVSVYYWWRAARMGPIAVPAGAMPEGGPGDQVWDYGGETALFLNYSRQSKLNALAAAWTGVSVFFQATAVILGLLSSSG
jgi:hypothetical protein